MNVLKICYDWAEKMEWNLYGFMEKGASKYYSISTHKETMEREMERKKGRNNGNWSEREFYKRKDGYCKGTIDGSTISVNDLKGPPKDSV